MIEKEFPNGFTSWIETYFELVDFILGRLNFEFDMEIRGVVTKRQEVQGRGGLYELAQELTDEFEELHKDREWDGEFFDTIEQFLKEKL